MNDHLEALLLQQFSSESIKAFVVQKYLVLLEVITKNSESMTIVVKNRKPKVTHDENSSVTEEIENHFKFRQQMNKLFETVARRIIGYLDVKYAYNYSWSYHIPQAEDGLESVVINAPFEKDVIIFLNTLAAVHFQQY